MWHFQNPLHSLKYSYFNKWIVSTSLKQYEKDNKLIIEYIAVIEVFEEINEAFKFYCILHRKDKTRELSFSNTNDELLIYKNKRIGLIR